MLKKLLLLSVWLMAAVCAQAQVITQEVEVSFGELIRLQHEGADKLIVGDDVQIIGNLGVNNASPEKTLDVSGSGRVTGHLNTGSIEIGGGSWKNLVEVTSDKEIPESSWTEIVSYGDITHGQGFRLLIRYSNKSNANHNYVSEVLGFCRHLAFSGSTIRETQRVNSNLGVNGEIVSASYWIDSDPSNGGCRVRAYLDIRGTSQIAKYVIKKETL